MTGPSLLSPSPAEAPAPARLPGDRLDSWKEIAAHLRRDVKTVQRWEKREGMPVHRHLHDRLGTVYAYRRELDAWARSRSRLVGAVERAQAGTGSAAAPAPARWRKPAIWSLGLAGAAMAAALAAWQVLGGSSRVNPLADARFLSVTDFGGVEQAAALSRDGRFAAFLSDRDGRLDVWLTQLGTGRFVDLTRGAAFELSNPSVRTLGFSPDGDLVTFWVRGAGGPGRAEIDTWAVPLLGGPPRPYLEGAAEHAWSGDGAGLVYHTAGPGDPMYVRAGGQEAEARQIFSAPAGLHAHYPVWSPDRRFIYFVQGALPDRLDLWRIRPTGGEPERITHHQALVSHPVFLDARTLLYLATDPDGLGPWIYCLDVERRVTRRVSPGIDAYTSLAASADGRRLVATVASPRAKLWRVPLSGGRADLAAGRPIPLTTGSGSSPRLGPGYLVYVSSKGDGDGLWRLQGGAAAELWSASGARIVGAPAIRRDGGQIAFTVRQGGRTVLQLVGADGTGARAVTGALELRGAPAWAPDGRSITVAAVAEGVPRLVTVPLDGGPAAPLVAEQSVDPAWSPSGELVAYSGPDVGTTFPVRAAGAQGSPAHLPELTLTRGARHLAFLPGGRGLVVMRGDLRHRDLWRVDLDTGQEERLLDLPRDFDLRDFDLSPDGRELVLEQVEERSSVVLIERPPGA